MADFTRANLRGSHFEQVYLNDSTLDQVDFSDGTLHNIRFRNARMTGIDMSDTRIQDMSLNGALIRGIELVNVSISGDIENLVINGVDVVPLVSAELDRRYPDRVKMRPTDPAGFRDAWDILERLWAGTIERARTFDPELLHVSVDGEWSFVETLRHLAFATESWLHRAILGDPSPWHALSLPWDQMPDTPGVPRDREVRPSLDVALELRHDRMAAVRRFIDGLTDESLAADTVAVDGPGWPENKSYPVRLCLRIILNEEWEHRLYAENDLDALVARESIR